MRASSLIRQNYVNNAQLLDVSAVQIVLLAQGVKLATISMELLVLNVKSHILDAYFVTPQAVFNASPDTI
jgi:hypothetical protein